MFAQRADVVFRKLIAFVDISADFAYKAFLAFCLWLRFYIVLVVGVGHGLLVTHDAGFGDTADEHSMSAEIHILLNLQRHECVDIFIQEYQSIAGTVDLLTCKFICASAGLEAELFKDRERCVHGQTVYVQNSRLLDDMMGVVGFIDVYSYTVRVSVS